MSGESKHCVTSLLSALSVSLSVSLSLPSLSLPQEADLKAVRLALLKSSCSPGRGAHPRRWCVVLLRLVPLTVKTLTAQRPPW